ncbi:MAG: helix-turn-helix transcriptional regulator [Nitrospinae bacterium]|nr:helix-turn-helix transcriptional regulator [Nitrospinota bacterium]
MKPQIIEKDGKPEWAIIPYKQYLEIVQSLDLSDDLRDLKKFRKTDDGERVPAEIVNRILDGENPVKVWREFRGLTQEALAGKSGIGKAYLSQIETGKRTGKAAVLKAIADALRVSVDEIIARD